MTRYDFEEKGFVIGVITFFIIAVILAVLKLLGAETFFEIAGVLFFGIFIVIIIIGGAFGAGVLGHWLAGKVYKKYYDQ